MFFCAFMSAFAQGEFLKQKHHEFTIFLESSLKNEVLNESETQEFYKKSWAYWHANKLDYNQHPEKYSRALSLFYKNKEKFKRNGFRDVNRYKDKISNFESFEKRNSLADNSILFIGSSSIAGWETAVSFPKLPIINRGLGGINLSEIIHYYDVLIKKHMPSVLVIYCDIDVEMGKLPSVVMNDFVGLVSKVKKDFPETKILLLSMKPTLIDDFIGKNIGKNKKITNHELLTYSQNNDNVYYVDIATSMLDSEGNLRADIFIADGMHLNMTGYKLWEPIVRNAIINATIH